MAASIEIAISQAVKEQVDKVLENPEFKTEIHQMFAEKCDPYVPYITGALAGNISVGSDGITYKQPYAEYVYDSANVQNTTYHPLASSRWDADSSSLLNFETSANAFSLSSVTSLIRRTT